MNMPNRRDLKKDINNMAFEVISECFSLMEYSPELNQEVITNILREAIELRNELVFKANHGDEIKNHTEKKEHFKRIIEDLYSKNVDLIDRLNKLNV